MGLNDSRRSGSRGAGALAHIKQRAQVFELNFMVVGVPVLSFAAADRKGDILPRFTDFCTENGSSPGRGWLIYLFLLDVGDTRYVGAGGVHPQADPRPRVPHSGVAARALRQRPIHRRLLLERRTHFRGGTLFYPPSCEYGTYKTVKAEFWP